MDLRRNIRSLGSNKKTVARLAAAEARGMHDAGVLSAAKHHHGTAKIGQYIDSHTGESSSDETVEELIDYSLYPYFELIKEGLIDEVMVKHSRFYRIDPDHPASLSAEYVKLIRERGFSGFAITDALNMMGVVAKYGKKSSVGLAVGSIDIFLFILYNKIN